MAAHNAAKKQKQKLAEIARCLIPSNSSKAAAQRIRGGKGRFLADAKKSEKMLVDNVPDVEISKPENIEPENVENDELEKSDEICDTQSTGVNDAEYTDIDDAPEEVNDLNKNKRYFSK